MAAEAISQNHSVALWQEYRRTRDVGIRNSLVLQHMGLVYQIARRYAALSRDAQDDLVQEGCLGLIRAIERFQPDYGVQFSTYAYPVISGTIKNYLRERRRLLGQSQWSREAAENPGSRREAPPFGGEELTAPESLEALAGEAADDFTDQVVERMVATSLIHRLPSLERQIVQHFFYDDLTQREVARIVARSTSRISRILRRALERIRDLLVDIQREEHRLTGHAAPSSRIYVPSILDLETGLFGPEHLSRSLRREVARAQGLSAPLTLALVRPNGADAPTTPAELTGVAQDIYRQVRVLDQVYRVGPCELAMIFSLPQREALLVCQRCQQGISRASLHYAIAAYPHDGDSPDDLLRVARERLARG